MGTSSYRDEVRADTPLVYYRLGELFGTTLVDESLNGWDGTYDGPTAGYTGCFGDVSGAHSFDGIDDRATISNNVSIVPGSSLTVEFWQYLATADVQGSSTFNIGNDSPLPNGCNAHFPWADGVGYWDFGDFQVGGRVTVDYTPYLDQWVHAALFFDFDTSEHGIYMDGVQVSSAFSHNAPVATVTGGQIGFGAGDYVKSLIDEFAIYNYALPGGRIRAHYDAALDEGNSLKRRVAGG